MGEYAEEARILERECMERNKEIYGCAKPGNPRYDNNYWQDVTGKVRHISDMDSMHLCFVIKYLLGVPYPNDFRRIRSTIMKEELKRRGYSEKLYKFNLEGVLLGLYCMYPEENGEVEEYYKNLMEKEVSGEIVSRFVYDTNMPCEVLNLSVDYLLCKHVLKDDLSEDWAPREKLLYKLSVENGYNNVLWGNHINCCDIEYHIDVIEGMRKVNLRNAVRIVGQQYKGTTYYWADNLHSLIRYMKDNNFDANLKLCDIPFYYIFVPESGSTVIYDYNGSVHNNVSDILGAIWCANKRVQRSSPEILKLGYTVGEFLGNHSKLMRM